MSLVREMIILLPTEGGRGEEIAKVWGHFGMSVYLCSVCMYPVSVIFHFENAEIRNICNEFISFKLCSFPSSVIKPCFIQPRRK